MTLIWFVVWFVADRLGDRAPLQFHPANTCAWTLLLAIALDLARQHAVVPSTRGRGQRSRSCGNTEG